MRAIVAALWIVAAAVPAHGAERFITVASTTSTEQSGLFDHILPKFKQKTGVDVRVVAQGTGQALETARRGDADVVFVHDAFAEKKFVEDGAGVKRHEVMYNDFVLVGPRADPAGVRGTKDIAAALQKIAKSRAPFASRGDDSGTHKAELRLWKEAGVDVGRGSQGWYRETGSGMGPTLNTASAMNAYALTDRGTWLSFRNRGDLGVAVQGDARLFNQYAVILVNPAKHSHIKSKEGQSFIDWLISPEGQQAIADYRVGGEQLFFPNGRKAAG